MFKMHQTLLPIVLLATVTLSSSNVLPILAINKLDTEPLLQDQNPDNTFKYKVNPNIFYKVFIGTPKDNLPKKSQISRLKIFDNDIDRAVFEDIDNDDDNSEGYRKEQWHNYPRQLDRLNQHVYKQIEEKLLEKMDIDKWQTANTKDEDGGNTEDVTEDYDSSILDGPLFILKIRLAYLTNDINQADLNKYLFSYLPIHLKNRKHDNAEDFRDNKIFNPSGVASVTKVKRKEEPREDQIPEKTFNENKAIKKRIFSLWSRLQSLSHRGHELQHRRHLYAFYGLPEEGGGALTAETRATFMRPPGSPLRWG